MSSVTRSSMKMEGDCKNTEKVNIWHVSIAASEICGKVDHKEWLDRLRYHREMRWMLACSLERGTATEGRRAFLFLVDRSSQTSKSEKLCPFRVGFSSGGRAVIQ